MKIKWINLCLAAMFLMAVFLGGNILPIKAICPPVPAIGNAVRGIAVTECVAIPAPAAGATAP